ncbi:hypothetical protein MKW98_021183 [Papaver atlanticum]|uniref:Uncharacterized protein n=1 Tax=Papaver atlanticum TaxID=357466 RepID=A0AAD4T9Z7_9MAGN|nr:hypothetical protein MKW98_021183 [Papaver atlanticum]
MEKKRQRNREKQEQARAEEDIRRERKQRENQFITERTKVRRVEGQRRRRLNEKEQQREKNRISLLNIRCEGSGQAIKQHEVEHINSSLDAQTSTVCGGEINLGGEPQNREQLMHDKEYRQRVLEERQRQTQLFSQQSCTQYILGESKVWIDFFFFLCGRKKAYNERKKEERAPKREPVQKVKSTKQTRSAAQKARREKEADMRRMAASSDAVTVLKLDLVPKARVRVHPETLYASLTEEEKYNILLRRGQIKEQVVKGQ